MVVFFLSFLLEGWDIVVKVGLKIFFFYRDYQIGGK